MGFANFILSLSLCLIAISCIRGHPLRAPRRCLLAAFFALTLALLSHPLPVAWATICVLVLALPSRPGIRWNLVVLMATLAAISILGSLARSLLRAPWNPRSLLFATGADQLAVFDPKYRVFSLLLLVSWALPLFAAARTRALLGAIRLPVGRIAVASAAAVSSLPAFINLPGSDTALAFLAPRSSVVVAICVIGLVASLAPFSTARLVSNSVLAGAWFATIGVDWHTYSRLFAGLESVAQNLSSDARVMASASQPASRVDWLTHIIDQVCIERCISFANYEPSTNVFRVRAASGNQFALSSARDLYLAESGQLRIPERPEIHVVRLLRDSRLEPAVFVAVPGTILKRECVDLLWQVPGFKYDRCRDGPFSRY